MAKAQVFIEQGEDGVGIAYRLMERLNAQELLLPSSKVLLKPNITAARPAASGVITHPSLLEGVLQYLRDCGVREAIIGEGGGCDISQAFEDFGFAEVARRYGAKLADFNREEEVFLRVPRPLHQETFGIARTVVECEVLINLPVLKVHTPPALVTLGLKNLMGCLVKDRSAMHQGFDEKIVDLAQVVPPTLNIIDGIVGLERQEIHGRPVGMKVVLASRDVVAVDAVAAAVMGFAEGEVHHIALAGEWGLGQARLAEIEILGPKVTSLRRPFQRAQ
ncbi:MAG TPA: DUF362 domain-containing protein [Armatimonadetes bacterium]|nr:DUF362 domain-containing protein [Armatimonadota bacterium]